MTTSQQRVPSGVPTGGQFAASAHAESGITLDAASTQPTDEWLPPGAHRIVDCADCAADPARRDQPGCGYCDRGKVTTDRYGQVPWHPGKPGTKVGFEDPRDKQWRSATITAMATESSEHYAVGLLAEGEARDVYLPKTIPLAAAQAAARHGIHTSEMIEEAACEMNIGIDPSLDEVRAFLARIDDGYHEDIARGAREFRTYRARELAEEGRTGPALDTEADPGTFDPEDLDRAIAGVAQHVPAMMHVTEREHWHGWTVAYDPRNGRLATYADTAWTPPEQQPMLPWSAPTGIPVAHVALDGTVRRIDQPGTL